MSSYVLDLQNDVTKSNCDIVNVLRKAHVIAVKLNLKDFDRWILCELNGYKDEDIVPEYRKVKGLLKSCNQFRGWMTVLIPDRELENKLSHKTFRESISEIIELSKQSKNDIIYEFEGNQQVIFKRVLKNTIQVIYALHFSRSKVGDIVEKIKNTILEWTIKLQSEGILGEGMQFNDKEIETAKQKNKTINYYFGNTNIINALVNNAAVVAGNENHVEFTYEKAKESVSEIETALNTDKLSTEGKETAIQMLADINDKISQKKKLDIIKYTLGALKDFLVEAGANVTAAVVEAKMKGLF